MNIKFINMTVSIFYRKKSGSNNRNLTAVPGTPVTVPCHSGRETGDIHYPEKSEWTIVVCNSKIHVSFSAMKQ